MTTFFIDVATQEKLTFANNITTGYNTFRQQNKPFLYGYANTHTSHAMIYRDYIKACFNGSCLLLNDSKQSQKRQERESQYIMDFPLFLYRPSLESQTGVNKDNDAASPVVCSPSKGRVFRDAIAVQLRYLS